MDGRRDVITTTPGSIHCNINLSRLEKGENAAFIQQGGKHHAIYHVSWESSVWPRR
jgi:catechol-2,3-dioxygenase